MSKEISGTFTATVVSADFYYTKNGNEAVAIGLQIDNDNPEVAGEVVSWRGFFTEKALKQTIKSLRTIGWEGNDLSTIDKTIGHRVSVVVEMEEFEGKQYPRVQWINPLGGMSINNAMGASEKKAFAARMKGAIMAFGDSTTTPTTTQSAPNDESDYSSDDLPF